MIYRVPTIDTKQSRASERRHNDSRPSPQSERKTNQSAGIYVRKSNNKRVFSHDLVYRLIPCLQKVWEMVEGHPFFFLCAPTGVLANMSQGRCKRKHDDAKFVPKLLIWTNSWRHSRTAAVGKMGNTFIFFHLSVTRLHAAHFLLSHWHLSTPW